MALSLAACGGSDTPSITQAQLDAQAAAATAAAAAQAAAEADAADAAAAQAAAEATATAAQAELDAVQNPTPVSSALYGWSRHFDRYSFKRYVYCHCGYVDRYRRYL